MKTLQLNVLMAVVIAAFLVLWLLPLGVLLVWQSPSYLIIVMGVVFGFITFQIWRAWRSVPDALQPKAPPGMQLRESDAPELFSLAANVKTETGMKSQVECWCDISPTISAVAYAEHVAAETKIALRNGIAALAVMSKSQIKILLRYHLTILTFSPRLMSMALKCQLVSGNFFYFTPYIKLFNICLRKVERYARDRAANIEETTEAIDLSREVTFQFQVFWATAMQPFLQTGNLMPIAEGFSQYWDKTHPAAKHRPALDMLDGFSRIENKLTSDLLKANPGIERSSWEQGRVILLESWKHTVMENHAGLQQITALDLCDGREKTPVLMMALAAALDRDGWRFDYAGAGSRVVFVKDGMELEPFQVECADWSSQCERLGIAHLPLA